MHSSLLARFRPVFAALAIGLPMCVPGASLSAERRFAVETAKAAYYCFADTMNVTGFLVPRQEAIVNVDVDGFQVSEILVREGATVKAGQGLVSLTRPADQGAPPTGARSSAVTLLSPTAGVVTRSTAIIGAYASPGAEPLFRIMVDHKDGQLELEVDVPNINLPKLLSNEERTAHILVENGAVGRIEMNGRVRRVGPEIDPKTQFAHVRVSVDRNPFLRPGMFARATISAKNRRCRYSVPLSAINYDGVPSVQVVRDGVINIKPVVTGLRSGMLIEVSQGIEDGDIVVVKAGNSLHDGDPVDLINELNH